MNKKSPEETTKINNSKSYFRTILFSFISISLIGSLTLTVFLTLNYAQSSRNIVTNFNYRLLAQTNYTIDQMNENVRQLNQMLFNDNNIISYLNADNPYGISSVLASQVLQKHNISVPYLDSIYLYNAADDSFFHPKPEP